MTQRDMDRTAGGERTDVVHRPIGVFDSGIGGLTVVRALRARAARRGASSTSATPRACPTAPSRPRRCRASRARASRFLVGRGVKLLVVACNTASAIALPHLQRRARSMPDDRRDRAGRARPRVAATRGGPDRRHRHRGHDRERAPTSSASWRWPRRAPRGRGAPARSSCRWSRRAGSRAPVPCEPSARTTSRRCASAGSTR